jgi:uncharacterized repeat protein (TIGR03809 family)
MQMPETMKPATRRLEDVALKWRDLAERRRDHLLELYRSGRWRRYYTGKNFIEALRNAVMMADRWAAIAPRAGEPPQEKAGASGPRPSEHGVPPNEAAVLPAAA